MINILKIKVFINLHLCGLLGLCPMHFFDAGAAKTCRTTGKLAYNQLGANSHIKKTRVQKTGACQFKWPPRDFSRFCRV